MSDAKPRQTAYDVVIIGAGHNGLTAAAYLAKAGFSVLILERREQVGGAAVSKRVFDGVNARLSAYAYLVSLFPPKIVQDLNLKFETRRRPVASFTPVLKNGEPQGLLVSNISERETEDAFQQLTGNRHEYEAFRRFYGLAAMFAERVWPTLLEPLQTRDELLRRFKPSEAAESWQMIVERPLGETLERTFHDDTVRGVVFTDAKIGVLTHPHDPSLLQNRTFLYHIIGNKTGEWRVPVGGMGVVTDELERAARTAGAEIITSADVEMLNSGNRSEVVFMVNGQNQQVSAKYVLVNATPTELRRLITGKIDESQRPNGSVFKINMLLKRLPRLKASNVSPEQAFAGTFHIDEGYEAMQQSYRAAASGIIPAEVPGEMYCHSLTDASILGSELHGYHTLTLFGLDTPYSLFTQNHQQTKQEVLARHLWAINRHLAEPLESCIADDEHGRPCLEAKSPVDLETELNMHGGNIFHNDLTWPFVEKPEERGMWGVETDYRNIFLCGAGARRGGCVSGIPGHNAAMKVLECERKLH